jgi:hypothetical protein
MTSTAVEVLRLAWAQRLAACELRPAVGMDMKPSYKSLYDILEARLI